MTRHFLGVALAFAGGGFVWTDGLLTRLDPALFVADINDR